MRAWECMAACLDRSGMTGEFDSCAEQAFHATVVGGNKAGGYWEFVAVSGDPIEKAVGVEPVGLEPVDHMEHSAAMLEQLELA